MSRSTFRRSGAPGNVLEITDQSGPIGPRDHGPYPYDTSRASPASVTIAIVKTFVALFLAATFTQADIPMTLVSEDEAEPIHSAIIRKEAWTQDPVRRLRAEADRRMREGPWSVTIGPPKGVDLDPHEYYSEAPY